MPHTTGVRRRKVAVLGATGTVGQRFISLLASHPWFELAALTTSERNAGKRYGDVTPWHFGEDMPAAIADMRLETTRPEVDAEICFSALPSEASQAMSDLEPDGKAPDDLLREALQKVGR